MFCQKCGNQLKDGVLFCRRCGTKVEIINTFQNENPMNRNAATYPSEGMPLPENEKDKLVVRRKGLVGKVIWFNSQKGYGFIKATIDTYTLTIFLHFLDINNFSQADIVDRIVIFDLQEHIEKNVFKASNVTLLKSDMTDDPLQ